jgi:hypothetical protein
MSSSVRVTHSALVAIRVEAVLIVITRTRTFTRSITQLVLFAFTDCGQLKKEAGTDERRYLSSEENQRNENLNGLRIAPHVSYVVKVATFGRIMLQRYVTRQSFEFLEHRREAQK